MATISESRFKFCMDMYWMEKRRGKKKSVTAKECQLLHFVLFVFLYVWKMIFSIYGAVWNGNGKYWIFQMIHFNMKRKEFSATTNFCSVTRTWTVSLCVCCVESGLCLSSYLCMYLCWFVMWKFSNMKRIPAFWLVN